MAEDWASIAYSLIPAAVGAALGGAGGGLYGFSKGVSGSAENRLETERYNKQIEFKNIDDARQQERTEQQRALEQQRIDLDTRRVNTEEARWKQFEQKADADLKFQNLHGQQLQLQIDAAKRSLEGQAAFRASLSPAASNRVRRQPEQRPVHERLPGRRQGEGPAGRRRRSAQRLRGQERRRDRRGRPAHLGRGHLGAAPRQERGQQKPVARLRRQQRAHYHRQRDRPNSIKTTKVPDWEPKEKKDEEIKEYNTIVDNALQKVLAPFKGPMGQIDMSKLGKTPAEQQQALTVMRDKQARADAKALGRGYLFDPTERLAKAITENKIQSTSQAVALLESHGVHPDKSAEVAKQVIERTTAARAKKEAQVKAAQKQAERERLGSLCSWG